MNCTMMHGSTNIKCFMLLGEKCFLCLGHEISVNFVWFVILFLTGNLYVNCRLTLCKPKPMQTILLTSHVKETRLNQQINKWNWLLYTSEIKDYFINLYNQLNMHQNIYTPDVRKSPTRFGTP